MLPLRNKYARKTCNKIINTQNVHRFTQYNSSYKNNVQDLIMVSEKIFWYIL